MLDQRADFYETIVAISGNAELSRFVPVPQTNLLRTQFVRHLSEADRERQFKEYDVIARYVIDGAAQSAEAAVRRHIKNSRLSIERLPDDAFAG